MIRDGCVACPANEDVWLEAARLQTPENAKTVLAEAVKKIPQSVKIWIHAASLETNVTMRRRVLRKSVEAHVIRVAARSAAPIDAVAVERLVTAALASLFN